MTKNDIDQLVINLDSKIDELQKVIELVQRFKHPEDCPGQMYVRDFGILITIRDMKGLHQARRFLRAEFGSWEDKLSFIWGDWEANARWDGKVGEITIAIRLSCDPLEFPKELHKRDGCGFKKTQRTELSYVCEKEGA